MPHFHLGFSTLLGVFPYTGSGRFSSRYAVYSFLVLGVFFYEVFTFDTSFYHSHAIRNLKTGWLIMGLVGVKRKLVVVVACVHVCKLIRYRTSVSEIYRLSGAPNNSVPFAFALAALTVKFAIEWGIYDFYNNPKRMVNHMIMFHINLIETAVLLQFCGFLKNFHRQLDRLYAFMRERKVTDASALVDLHAEILSRMKLSNAIYSHQILSACIIYGEFMIVNLLLLVVELVNDKGLLALANGAFTASFYFTMLSYLSTRCQRTMETANDFNIALFQVVRNNNELYCNEKLLLYVKMKQTVQFTACGFFTLGFPLLTSVMAVVTTYLVILLQFSLPNQ